MKHVYVASKIQVNRKLTNTVMPLADPPVAEIQPLRNGLEVLSFMIRTSLFINLRLFWFFNVHTLRLLTRCG